MVSGSCALLPRWPPQCSCIVIESSFDPGERLQAPGLLHCENFIVQRNIFHTRIREINNDLPIDELTLLFGNEILNDEKYTQIVLQVQKFIQDSGRFTIN